MDKCPKCELENTERYWMQSGNIWVCSWCYNGNYTIKQIKFQRKKYAKKNETDDERHDES